MTRKWSPLSAPCSDKLNRPLCGDSGGLNGVVLDDASCDDADPFLHRVFGSDEELYFLPKSVVDRCLAELDRNKKNDILRRLEERLVFGQNIQFTATKRDGRNIIQDYQRGGECFQPEAKEGVKYMKTTAAFKEDLSMVFVHGFGTLAIGLDEAVSGPNLFGLCVQSRLFSTVLPTPNTDVFVLLRFHINEELRKVHFYVAEVQSGFDDVEVSRVAAAAVSSSAFGTVAALERAASVRGRRHARGRRGAGGGRQTDIPGWLFVRSPNGILRSRTSTAS